MTRTPLADRTCGNCRHFKLHRAWSRGGQCYLDGEGGATHYVDDSSCGGWTPKPKGESHGPQNDRQAAAP